MLRGMMAIGFITLLVLSVVLIQDAFGAGLKCYECRGPGCEYMAKKLVTEMECATAKPNPHDTDFSQVKNREYLCEKGEDQGHVYRHCTLTQPEDVNSTIVVGCHDLPSGRRCYCDTDFCNTANDPTTTASLFWSLTFATTTSAFNIA